METSELYLKGAAAPDLPEPPSEPEEENKQKSPFSRFLSRLMKKSDAGVSLTCSAAASGGRWITGTCRGGEVGGDLGGRDVSSRLLRPSRTGGASHSVTTSTSSSDGRSNLASLGGRGSRGVWTRCRITPENQTAFTFT